MNERIKELAEQAIAETTILNDWRDNGQYCPPGYSTGVSKRLMDRFAKLIIHECARVSRTNANGLIENGQGWWNDGKVESATNIATHFGVENERTN